MLLKKFLQLLKYSILSSTLAEEKKKMDCYVHQTQHIFISFVASVRVSHLIKLGNMF